MLTNGVRAFENSDPRRTILPSGLGELSEVSAGEGDSELRFWLNEHLALKVKVSIPSQFTDRRMRKLL